MADLYQQMQGGIGWLALLAVLGLWMLGAHNRLTALRAAILSAWQPLESALQARARALGAVLAAAAGPLADERAALDGVAAALSQVESATEAVRRRPVAQSAVAELGKADAVLAAVSLRLLALAGQQPELQADADVQSQLSALKELLPRLQFARQTFNEAGERYNEALAQFPTRLLVPVFRFDPAGQL